MPFGQYWYCALITNMIFSAMLCSILLILNMTFDRFYSFYSIIRPHKAASFNTVKRAQITIVCIIVISIIFNIPHWFVTMNDGWLCVPFSNRQVMDKWYSKVFYWLSFAFQYAIPFVSLLSMNCVIIHTLCNRMRPVKRQHVMSGGQELDKGQGQSSRSSEMQIYIILLLVTFAFLILSTPAYLFFIINLVFDFRKSPKIFAIYHLYVNAAQKLHYTNYGINFFLYVISGQKFRTDLKNLFRIKRSDQRVTSNSNNTSVNYRLTHLQVNNM